MKKGILLAVLASVLWAIVNPFIKQGLSYGFTPMNFAGLRFTIVGILLFAWTWHRGMWREIVRQRRLFANLILINMFLGYSAISVSEDKGKVDPVFLNAVQMFFGGLLIYGVGIAAEGFHPFWARPAGFYASLGVLVFISVFAFSFWFMALRTPGTKVSDVNMCRLINPVLGAVLSWVMLPDESPDFSTVAGMLVIVSSLVIYFKGEALVQRWRRR